MLAVVLLLVWPIVSGPTIVHPDEAVYGAQARNIAHGSWFSSRPAPDLDPDAVHEPLFSEIAHGDQVIPYARHITYPLLLVPGWILAGRAGMILISIIALWGAAVMSGLIARMISTQLGTWSLWSIGFGSPLVFYGYTTIGHTIGAALFGVTFCGVSSAIRDSRYRHLLYALPAAVLTVMIRSEGLVVIGSLGATICVLACGIPSLRRFRWPEILIGLAVGSTAILAYMLDNRLVRIVTGEVNIRVDPTKLVLGKDAGPMSAAWSSLFRPWHGTGIDAVPWPLLTSVSLLIAAIAWRLSSRRPLLPLSLLAMGLVSGVSQALGAPRLITGLFVALPTLLPGLLLISRIDYRSPVVKRVIISSALSFTLLIVSIYESGGASEWGGRFFQILLPIVVPVSLLGWSNLLSKFEKPIRRYVIVCLLTISLAMSVSALRINHAMYVNYKGFRSAVLAAALKTSDSASRPLVLVGTQDGSSRYFWDDLNQVDVLTAAAPPNLLYLIQQASKSRGRVVVVSPYSPELFDSGFGPGLKELGWSVIQTPSNVGIAYLYVLGPSGS
ncbi:MAG: hypothetical protein KDB26_04625 [Microthrixaceae bacterium]|nr:hypothetical protein [Microthrixaceae bacterium]